MGKATINVRALAAVSAFASKDPVRLGLNGVCVEIDETSVTYIATDGTRMLVHREYLVDEAEMNTMTGKFVIPTAQCRIHKTKEIPLGELSDDGGALTLTFDHVGIIFDVIGPFAEWRRVIPTKPLSGASGQFDADLAASFQKLGKSLGLGPQFICWDGETNPALVRWYASPNTLGVLMPRKVAPAEGDLPSWSIPADRAEAA